MRIPTYMRLGAVVVVAVLIASLAAALLGAPALVPTARSGVAPAAATTSCTITVHKETAQNDAVQRVINAFGSASTPSTPVTICLGANTFPEQLTITGTTDLSIVGLGSGSTFLAPTSVSANGVNLDSPSSSVDAIIGAWNNTGLTISGLDVNGSLAASGLYNNCAATYLGVYYANTSGTLNGTTVSGINTNGGCQGQTAVYVNTGFFATGHAYATAVAITNSTITGFGKGGIVCRGLGLTCDVTGNSVVTTPQPLGYAATNGIEFWAAAGAITGNYVSGNDYLPGSCLNQNYFDSGASCTSPYWSGGVLVLSTPSDVNVSGNTLSDNQVGVWSIGGPTSVWGNDFPVSSVGYYAVVLDFNPADAFGLYASAPYTGSAGDNAIAGQNVGILAYDDNATLVGNTFSSVNVSIEVATDSAAATTTEVADNSGSVNTSGALLGDISSFQSGDAATATGTYTVTGNSFTNVSSSAASDGLLVYGAAATVSGNTLTAFPHGIAVVVDPTGTLTATANQVVAPASGGPGSGFYAFAGNASIASNQVSGYSFETGPGWWPDSQATGIFAQCYAVCDLTGNTLTDDAIGIAVLSYVYGPFPAPSWPNAAPPSVGPINVSSNLITDSGAFGLAFELNQATNAETATPSVSVWNNTVNNTVSGAVGLMVDQGSYAIVQNTFLGTSASGLSGSGQDTGVGIIDTASIQVLDAYDSVTNACLAGNRYLDTSLFVALLNLTTAPPYYASTCGAAPVTFSESGLPASTAWGVTVGGQSYATTDAAFTVDVAGGSNGYTVAPEPGYTASPPSGTLTVAGTALVQDIVFAVPMLSVSPGQGPEGASVTVAGTGFTASTTLSSLVFDGVPVASCASGSLTPAADGSWSCTLAVPAGTSGTSVVATDAGGITASASFQVTSTQVTITPGQGPEGASVTVSGTGFSVSSTLSSLDFDGVAIAACTTGALTTDATGSFSCGFAVPSGTSSTSVVATDTGGQTASGSFVVTTPAILVAPGQGPVGASVTVSGTGFSVSGTVALDFAGVSDPACSSGSLATDASGAFSCSFAVPSGTSGSVVSATDIGGSIATGSFTVTTPALSVAPGQGPVGASVTVMGSGYSVSTPLASLLFDGVALSSCSSGSLTTDASGAFSCTTAVPSGTSGSTVSATDVGGQAASSSFVVTPLSLGVSPGRGPAGANVTVAGTGFSVSSTVALSFDNVAVAGCAAGSLTTNATGAFLCALDVPAGTSGTAVVATDAGGQAAATTFTVTTPHLRVAPTRGPAGATVTVTGTGFTVSSAVTLVFDGVTIASCPGGGGLTTLASGGFTCTLPVPTGTSGNLVRATDASGAHAGATFTVTVPAIFLNKHQGPVGSLVTVRGTGYSSSRRVAIVFDNVAVSSCSTGSLLAATNGSFSCTFAVPSGTSGSTVTVTDIGGSYATSTFRVT